MYYNNHRIYWAFPRIIIIIKWTISILIINVKIDIINKFAIKKNPIQFIKYGANCVVLKNHIIYMYC